MFPVFIMCHLQKYFCYSYVKKAVLLHCQLSCLCDSIRVLNLIISLHLQAFSALLKALFFLLYSVLLFLDHF